LSLNRSSLYYKPAGPSLEEIAIKRHIDEIYTFYKPAVHPDPQGFRSPYQHGR